MAIDDAILRGAKLFDDGAFFDAHDAWEERWQVLDDGDERLALQGLIQIAAAFHKLYEMTSPESAERLLARGIAKIEGRALPGLDLVRFREQIMTCSGRLTHLVRAEIPRLGSR